MKKAELGLLVFILGALGFNWPFVEIFGRGLAAYLFVFWFVLILMTAFAGFRSS